MSSYTSDYSLPIFDPTEDALVSGTNFINALTGKSPQSAMNIINDALVGKTGLNAKTSIEWEADTTTIIRSGEFGITTDTGVVKFGNGIDIWNGLEEYSAGTPVLSGDSIPTNSTEGLLGQLFLYLGENYPHFYICRNIVPDAYEWERLPYCTDLEDKLDSAGDGSDVVTYFSVATDKENISSGETLAMVFGKIAKWFSSFGNAAWRNVGTTADDVAAGDHDHGISDIENLNGVLAGKQNAVTVEGILKGTGAEIGSAIAGLDYSLPTITKTGILLASAWVYDSTNTRYLQSITVPGLLDNTAGEVGLAAGYSPDESVAAAQSNITVAAQSVDTLTFSVKFAPNIDLHIAINIESTPEQTQEYGSAFDNLNTRLQEVESGKQNVINVSGMLKCNGSDVLPAVAGVDYVAPLLGANIGTPVFVASNGGLEAKSVAQARELLGVAPAEQIANRIYSGVDLTTKFAAEITAAPYNGDPWAWIRARIQAANFTGLYVGDYIPFTAGGNVIKAEIGGIDTYYNCGIPAVGHHIDFISRDCWPDAHVFNRANYNNGTGMSPIPWLASDLYAWLNSLATQVPNTATENPTMATVDYSTTGVYDKLPTALKAVIVPKWSLLPIRYTSGALLVDDNSWTWVGAGKLWVPSEIEVYGCAHWGSQNGYASGGFQQYPIFATNMRCIKGAGDGGVRASWWLLSARGGNSTHFAAVPGDGAATNTGATNASTRTPLCFRIA